MCTVPLNKYTKDTRYLLLIFWVDMWAWKKVMTGIDFVIDCSMHLQLHGPVTPDNLTEEWYNRYAWTNTGSNLYSIIITYPSCSLYIALRNNYDIAWRSARSLGVIPCSASLVSSPATPLEGGGGGGGVHRSNFWGCADVAKSDCPAHKINKLDNCATSQLASRRMSLKCSCSWKVHVVLHAKPTL